MTSVSAFFNSPSAPSTFVRAFMAQSKAATLQSLSFFNGKDEFDTASFTQMAVDSSIVTSLIQGGNTALFGSIYKDAKGFNQSLMTSVAGAAGINLDDNSLLGQLINKVA
ncbi:MAG: hypothetical protein QM783_20365 [Phycisphaerales bacterium]